MDKSKEKTLIIGWGEIGKALGEVFSDTYVVDWCDFATSNPMVLSKEYDVVHICFPYTKNFNSALKDYLKRFKAELVIIHSTVPVGTTRLFGKRVVHSAVIGRHPSLAPAIRTFQKAIGGTCAFSVQHAVDFLQRAKIRTWVVSSPEVSELGKILDTTYSAWNVVWMKEVERICRKMDLPFFEIYKCWGENFNEGYAKLGQDEVRRPVFIPMPGKIGGHCLMPNCELFEDWTTALIKARNKVYDQDWKV